MRALRSISATRPRSERDGPLGDRGAILGAGRRDRRRRLGLRWRRRLSRRAARRSRSPKARAANRAEARADRAHRPARRSRSVARPRPPGPDPRLRILSIVLIVAGGVGLAAFPITARLTARLEALRSGVERWGAGALSLRVDDAGDDEVAVVARTFNVAAQRVEALLTSQKALLANASHELRSPLARLRMAVELWLADRARDLQAEIVAKSRRERSAGRRDPAREPARSWRAAVQRARRCRSCSVLPPKRRRASRRRSRTRRSGRPVEIDGDRALLRRLIRNLLENAVKHGRPPIRIAVTRRDGKARIVVSDCGEGIAPAERERVFEPFYRPAGRGESSGGWGLGLSLVRQIAAATAAPSSAKPNPAAAAASSSISRWRQTARPKERALRTARRPGYTTLYYSI